jgi:hypothetical protein
MLSPQAVESNAQRGVLVSLGDAGHNRFPSVLLQPLGHLSVFKINDLRAACSRLSHTPAPFLRMNSITFEVSDLEEAEGGGR